MLITRHRLQLVHMNDATYIFTVLAIIQRRRLGYYDKRDVGYERGAIFDAWYLLCGLPAGWARVHSGPRAFSLKVHFRCCSLDKCCHIAASSEIWMIGTGMLSSVSIKLCKGSHAPPAVRHVVMKPVTNPCPRALLEISRRQTTCILTFN